jgi:phosphate acetyltransferase
MFAHELKTRASALNARVVLPDSADPRTIEAAEILTAEGVATPVLVDANTPINESALVAHLLERRASRGLTPEQAAALARTALFRAAWMVHTGEADVGVAGSLSTTADVLRAGIYTIGPAPDVQVVSSFFLMSKEDGPTFTYADCGVVPDPTAAQLADIAWSAAQNHQRLTLQEPRVAFLSFSTKGSADHPHVTKVREAFEMFTAAHPDVIADGELQADAAIVPLVAHRKAPESQVAGMANVLVFPDLNAGNIAYKLTQRLGGFDAYGPIVQGLRKPFVDLSRGCSVQDIVMAACIAAVISSSSQGAAL